MLYFFPETIHWGKTSGISQKQSLFSKLAAF